MRLPAGGLHDAGNRGAAGSAHSPTTRICFEWVRVLEGRAALWRVALDRTPAAERAFVARARLRLDITKTPSHMSAQHRAATAEAPRRPSGAGGGKGQAGQA
jgi:hypothetical protein